MRASWTYAILPALPLALVMHAFGCFTTSSTTPVNSTGSGGAAGTGGSSSSGSGGSAGSNGCGGSDCGDPCAGVRCPLGELCDNSGTCVATASCDAGTDCASCTDLVSCASCYSIAHSNGWQTFTSLRYCITCQSCYYSCNGATTPGLSGGEACTAAPAQPDACDSDAGGGCAACSACAIDGGTCGVLESDCANNADCTALLMAIPGCPSPADGG